jgi:plasmid maintenance system antidote protein VapI
MRPMVRRPIPPRKASSWFVREWMDALGKIQADLTKELDWPKAKANRVFNGQQRYNEDLVLELSAWLNLRPYELLLTPQQAMGIRNLRKEAARIVSDAGSMAEEDAENLAVPKIAAQG